MSNAIQLGPFLLPFSLLLVFASAGVTVFIGKRLSKQVAPDVETTLWTTLLVGVVIARCAFVYEYWTSYAAAPLTVIDIRDGGWSPTFGLMGAWLFALYRGRRVAALRRPLGWALGVGTAVYLVGTAVLATSVSRQTLPGLAFSSLDGKTVRLDEFRGKPTVVNLWATWCPPCVREMPVLHEAQEQYPDVHFVFLNQGEHPQQVAAWLSSRRLPVRNVLVDPRRQASSTFNQRGYPSTLFFNAKGELVSVRVGELSRATLEERLGAVTRRRRSTRSAGQARRRANCFGSRGWCVDTNSSRPYRAIERRPMHDGVAKPGGGRDRRSSARPKATRFRAPASAMEMAERSSPDVSLRSRQEQEPCWLRGVANSAVAESDRDSLTHGGCRMNVPSPTTEHQFRRPPGRTGCGMMVPQ